MPADMKFTITFEKSEDGMFRAYSEDKGLELMLVSSKEDKYIADDAYRAAKYILTSFRSEK